MERRVDMGAVMHAGRNTAAVVLIALGHVLFLGDDRLVRRRPFGQLFGIG